MARAVDPRGADRKWNTSDLRRGFHGAPPRRVPRNRRKKKQRSGGERAAAGEGRRGEERPRESGCLLNIIFSARGNFHFFVRRLPSPPFREDRCEIRKGGGAPRVSASTCLVRGRRNASLLVLSFVKPDATSRPLRCLSLSFLPAATTRTTTRTTSREEIGVD